MVDGMDGGINDFMTCISSRKQYSKSDIQACEEELLKGKSIQTSEKSQFLGDESSRLRGGLSKKGYDISDSYISENKFILYSLENYINISLKA